MSQIFKWSFNYCRKAPEKNGAKKTKQKKLICRVPTLALGKEAFAECQVTGHSAKIFFKKNKKPFAECLRLTVNLCRAPGKDFFADGQSLPSARHSAKGNFCLTAKVCRVSGSRQRQICRRPIFAECRALGKIWPSAKVAGVTAATCRQPLPSAPPLGARQRGFFLFFLKNSLPSAL